MSIDLEGWYISQNRQYNWHRVAGEKRLHVLGANHSEGSLGMRNYDADEKFTFQEQVEKVTQRLLESGWDDEDVAEFRKEAEEFQAFAEKLQRPIRSYWL